MPVEFKKFQLAKTYRSITGATMEDALNTPIQEVLQYIEFDTLDKQVKAMQKK